MLDKKIIKEISKDSGIVEKNVESVIKSYLKKKYPLNNKQDNILQENTNSDISYIIESVNRVAENILHGKKPDPIKLPETIKNKFFQDFIENINKGVILYWSAAEYIEKLASGNLDSVSPPGETAILSSLTKYTIRCSWFNLLDQAPG